MAQTSEPLRRAAAIAEFVAMESDGTTIAKIAENLGLPVPTTFRLVRRLVDVGFLEGEGRNAVYVTGPRLRRIANFIRGGGSFSAIAELVLQQVADQLGVAIYLAGFFEEAASLLLVKTPTAARAPSVHPGPSFLIHASASGKLLLAYQPKEVVDKLLSQGLERLTERTITDSEVLRAQLREIRQRGYAISIGESDPSLWGIAFPIEGSHSPVIFAVGLITFRRTIEDDAAYVAEVLPVLSEAARKIPRLSRFS